MTKVKAIETTDGTLFKDVDEARQHEIALLLVDASIGDARITVSIFIIQNQAKFLDALTMKANSRPSARKANGATRKPRTTKVSQAQAGAA